MALEGQALNLSRQESHLLVQRAVVLEPLGLCGRRKCHWSLRGIRWGCGERACSRGYPVSFGQPLLDASGRDGDMRFIIAV